ncbi:FAD-linked sulfhydryl oxidase ERV2 [Candida parapsilosis]|uniref:Sulfhydryl oxidase n=1 Tax=Candida parapsilosis (strain CDC 317 / ATCC MYA-4646) TaxID=578454 RepID=G8BKI2_CANPC|nr:uncharacterized protein CPAR2_702600 [Candida parapsilosis]KAI5903184.1 FAD-linked sulfhydryl oxidase ERV2 [Candida parapsilosis]KAI5910722.1 FAD-linked sulfhydryl oxidase ERV2 [Candida parapsilosis]CAD1812772.1 unnamed protein product [Candida parapsilosis]CCE45247.1 hypothetical protein CPAR2_702600 [Candida parapsilosis]
MLKYSRRPIVTTISLLSLICVIYFMSSSSQNLESSLGKVRSPINLNSDTLQSNLDTLLQRQVQSGNQVQEPLEEPPSSGNEAGALPAEQKQQPQTINNDDEVIVAQAFMPKMANETLKAELGRASWRLFHTILARYPDEPSTHERTTLGNYIQLFAQVYPCGDCARHFQQLLNKYPPQTKSRKTAALWGCDIHNKVNDRLKKPQYDCTKILENYDCGCGSDEQEADSTLKGESLSHLKGLKVEKEELQRGG